MVSFSASPALRRALNARRLVDAALVRPTPAAVAVVGALAGSLPPALRGRLTAGWAAGLAGLTVPLPAIHPTATALAALDGGAGERLAAAAEGALAACSVAASAALSPSFGGSDGNGTGNDGDGAGARNGAGAGDGDGGDRPAGDTATATAALETAGSKELTSGGAVRL